MKLLNKDCIAKLKTIAKLKFQVVIVAFLIIVFIVKTVKPILYIMIVINCERDYVDIV